MHTAKQSAAPPIYYGRPPSPRDSTSYGLYVYERWEGVTAIEALDRDGATLCEAQMPTDLLEPRDIEVYQRLLAERSRAAPVRHLSVVL